MVDVPVIDLPFMTTVAPIERSGRIGSPVRGSCDDEVKIVSNLADAIRTRSTDDLRAESWRCVGEVAQRFFVDGRTKLRQKVSQVVADAPSATFFEIV